MRRAPEVWVWPTGTGRTRETGRATGRARSWQIKWTRTKDWAGVRDSERVEHTEGTRGRRMGRDRGVGKRTPSDIEIGPGVYPTRRWPLAQGVLLTMSFVRCTCSVRAQQLTFEWPTL